MKLELVERAGLKGGKQELPKRKPPVGAKREKVMGGVGNLDELTRVSKCLVCKWSSLLTWLIVMIIGAVPLQTEVGQKTTGRPSSPRYVKATSATHRPKPST